MSFDFIVVHLQVVRTLQTSSASICINKALSPRKKKGFIKKDLLNRFSIQIISMLMSLFYLFDNRVVPPGYTSFNLSLANKREMIA